MGNCFNITASMRFWRRPPIVCLHKAGIPGRLCGPDEQTGQWWVTALPQWEEEPAMGVDSWIKYNHLGNILRLEGVTSHSVVVGCPFLTQVGLVILTHMFGLKMNGSLHTRKKLLGCFFRTQVGLIFFFYSVDWFEDWIRVGCRVAGCRCPLMLK